jgi:hypothetical protein
LTGGETGRPVQAVGFAFFAGLMMSISLLPSTVLIRQTTPQEPHSFNGDSAALNPPECMSTSTVVLSPQLGHFMAFSLRPDHGSKS